MITPWNSDSWRVWGQGQPVSYRYNATLNQAPTGLSYLQRPALNTPYNSTVYPISGYGGQSTAAQVPVTNPKPYAGIVNWQSFFGLAPAISRNPVAIPYGPNPLGILSGNIIGQ